MGTVAGPLIGAVLFIIIDRLLGAIAGQGLLLLGALSILLMLTLPRGVMGLLNDRREALYLEAKDSDMKNLYAGYPDPGRARCRL